MFLRISLLAVLAVFSAFAQSPLKTFSFGGSGDDSANGLAVDSAGNIYVVGTTTSFDLPVVNAAQANNSGTQVIVSQDAGVTWKPLATPFPAATPLQPLVIAVDPTNSQTLYVSSGNSVCKSSDGGANFHCVALPLASGITTGVSSLVIDPAQTSTLYASATVPGSVYKTVNGGQTWTSASQGLPTNESIDSVTLDPFHSNVLYAWAGIGGYVSQDGAASWTRSSLPWPAGTTVSGGLSFSFDPVTPGIIYGPAFVVNQVEFQKSSDGGKTWTIVNAPFSTCCVVTDPKVSGVLYALVRSALWKSTDGGVTWNSPRSPRARLAP